MLNQSKEASRRRQVETMAMDKSITTIEITIKGATSISTTLITKTIKGNSNIPNRITHSNNSSTSPIMIQIQAWWLILISNKWCQHFRCSSSSSKWIWTMVLYHLERFLPKFLILRDLIKALQLKLIKCHNIRKSNYLLFHWDRRIMQRLLLNSFLRKRETNKLQSLQHLYKHQLHCQINHLKIK